MGKTRKKEKIFPEKIKELKLISFCAILTDMYISNNIFKKVIQLVSASKNVNLSGFVVHLHVIIIIIILLYMSVAYKMYVPLKQ